MFRLLFKVVEATDKFSWNMKALHLRTDLNLSKATVQ